MDFGKNKGEKGMLLFFILNMATSSSTNFSKSTPTNTVYPIFGFSFLNECATVSSVPEYWRCDGEEDCYNGIDEENCTTSKCPRNKTFRCLEGLCIYDYQRCNGYFDCPVTDNSDEDDCDFICKSGQFDCDPQRHHRLNCVRQKYRCDGISPCYDDERPGLYYRRLKSWRIKNCSEGKNNHMDNISYN